MAVMPSFGRIKQFSVLGVAAAVLVGVAAPKASASNDVWLWACGGPGGTLKFDPNPQNGGPFQWWTNGSGIVNFEGQPAATTVHDACDTTGITLANAANSPGSSSANVQWGVPGGLSLKGVSVIRTTHGFGAPVAGDHQTYTLSTVAGGTLESRDDSTATGDFTGTTPPMDTNGPVNAGDAVKLSVACATGPCGASPASVDITSVGLKVAEPDNALPTVAVGGTRNPTGGTIGVLDAQGNPTTEMRLDVRGTDSGVGLKSAKAFWEGVGEDLAPAANGNYNGAGTSYPDCVDLDVTNSAADLPLGANCAHSSSLTLKTDTAKIPNGDHTLVVQVTDWAGNMTEQKFAETVINNPDLGTNTQTLSIGTSGINSQQGSTNNSNNNGGGVAGASSQNCNTPRLSVVLAQKPVKISHGVPVLLAKKRYRFTGRLTCVINGKRRSAPKRARIDLRNLIGKKTYIKSGTTVHDKGKFTIIVAYRSSRTLAFRFTNSDGKLSQVKIKIKVEKAKKKK